MGIYTVHMKGSPDEPSAIERAVFVREGFGWWAFLFGPAWLLWNRAWFTLLGWIVLQIALGWMVQTRAIPMSAQTVLELIIALGLGFEAGTIRRYVLRRRGFQMVDVVQERRLIDAERRFFARATTHDHAPVPRSSMSAGSPSLVGLFPSAGA
jgi:hypothetical protein